MGNTNSPGVQDGDRILARFREADKDYESASEADKPSFFARRHAALMLLLDMHPSTHREVCEVMRVALSELAKDLMHEGPVPSAVLGSLTSCLQAVEDIGISLPSRENVATELRANESVPQEPLVDLDTGATKLDSLAGLLAYLANSSSGRDVQAVFLALLTNVENVRDLISGAADELVDAAPER